MYRIFNDSQIPCMFSRADINFMYSRGFASPLWKISLHEITVDVLCKIQLFHRKKVNKVPDLHFLTLHCIFTFAYGLNITNRVKFYERIVSLNIQKLRPITSVQFFSSIYRKVSKLSLPLVSEFSHCSRCCSNHSYRDFSSSAPKLAWFPP